MRIVLHHLAADVSGDSHEGILARLPGLRQFRYTRVPEVVKAYLQLGTFEGSTPRGTPRRDGLRGVNTLLIRVLPLADWDSPF